MIVFLCGVGVGVCLTLSVHYLFEEPAQPDNEPVDWDALHNGNASKRGRGGQ